MRALNALRRVAAAQCVAAAVLAGTVVTASAAATPPKPVLLDDNGSTLLTPIVATGISCPSTTQCTVVDDAGLGDTLISGYTDGMITAGGNEITFNPQDPGTPQPVSIDASATAYTIAVNDDSLGLGSADTAGLSGIACPSTTECVAIDVAGNELTFDPQAPGTPTLTPIEGESFVEELTGENGPGDLVAVSCPSTTECVALSGGLGEITFDPEDPGTPQPVEVDAAVQIANAEELGLACPSTTECFAIDDQSEGVEFNPQAPVPRKPISFETANGVDAITCASQTLCLANDSNGGDIPFDPLAAPGSTYPDNIIGLDGPVACAASDQCTSAGDATTATLDPGLPLSKAIGMHSLRMVSGALEYPTREISCATASECTVATSWSAKSFGGPLADGTVEITFDPGQPLVTSRNTTICATRPLGITKDPWDPPGLYVTDLKRVRGQAACATALRFAHTDRRAMSALSVALSSPARYSGPRKWHGWQIQTERKLHGATLTHRQQTIVVVW